MVSSNDSIIERLQDTYDRAINASGRRDFFLSLFEYVTVYDEISLLEEVIKDIVSKGKQDIKKQSELAEKALVEMQKVYEEVKKYVDENKVTSHQVVYNLNQFAALDNGSLYTSQGPIKSHCGFLSYALMTLAEDQNTNHLLFVRKYGVVTDEHRIQSWHFSPSYDLWEQESNWLDRIKLTKTWYSWDRLVLFYTVYRDYEKMVKTKLENNQIWEAYSLHDLFGEIKDIIANKISGPEHTEFLDGEFKTHLQRVHSHSKQYLASIQNHQEVNAKITYRLAGNVLLVGTKELKLRKDTRKLRLLKLLSESPKGIYYSEVVEKIDGAISDDAKDPKNTYYEVCRGISNSLAKIGVTDFLDYDLSQAKINSDYKRTSK